MVELRTGSADAGLVCPPPDAPDLDVQVIGAEELFVVLSSTHRLACEAELKFGSDAATSFQIADGLAMSNAGVLSDGNPANVQPLNAAATGSPTRPASSRRPTRSTTRP